MEIIIVIILVIATIPVWMNFDERISKAAIMSIDNYNLDFSIEEASNMDIIYISNDYYINKSYRLLLKLSKDVDTSSTIIINKRRHDLDDFFRYESGGYYFYTLSADHISGELIVFQIEPRLMGKDVNYTYVLEESNNF